MYVHTPLITGSDCEAQAMFQVTTLDLSNPPRLEDGSIDYSKDFFGKETNLTVSGQLNVEAFAQTFRNVYTFGPTFRAENSNTTRHAAEFWMIEPEMAFADLSDDMRVAEDMIKFVIAYVLENAPEEMAFFNQFVDKGLLDRLNHVMTSRFGHVTYTGQSSFSSSTTTSLTTRSSGAAICRPSTSAISPSRSLSARSSSRTIRRKSRRST